MEEMIMINCSIEELRRVVEEAINKAISKSNSSPEYMTTYEVAEFYKVNPRTVQYWMKAGRLKGYVVGGGSLRLIKSEVEEAIRERKILKRKR